MFRHGSTGFHLEHLKLKHQKNCRIEPNKRLKKKENSLNFSAEILKRFLKKSLKIGNLNILRRKLLNIRKKEKKYMFEF